MKNAAPLAGVGVALLLAGSAVLIVTRRAPRPAPPTPDVAVATSAAKPAPAVKKPEESFELDPDEKSRAELKALEDWRAQHPDDLVGARDRYRELATRYPETEAARYSERAAHGLDERISDQRDAAKAAAAEKESELARAKAADEAARKQEEARAERERAAVAAKAADESRRAEAALRDLARSGHIDDARAKARGALADELARLAAGRDALRAALTSVEGERVESFDEEKLAFRTRKGEVPLAKLAKPPHLAGKEAADAADFLLMRGAGVLALALAEAAGKDGEPLLEKARAAAAAEKSQEVAAALDAAIASADASKLGAALERYGKDPAFAARKDAWKDAYTRAREKVLLADPAQLFHGDKHKTLASGLVSVLYDWKDPRSAQDWLADPACANSSIKVDGKRGQARIEGHVRNPARFAGKVHVRATLAPLTAAAPNASVLLHDQGGWDGVLVSLGWDAKGQSKITLPRDAPAHGGQSLAPPLDAVVLPLGADKPAKWKVVAAERDDFATAGSKLRLDIVKDDKALVVRANGASIFELAPAPLPGQLGGVGFLPDGSTLVVFDVLIEGKLDPEWHRSTAAERARAEADELAR